MRPEQRLCIGILIWLLCPIICHEKHICGTMRADMNAIQSLAFSPVNLKSQGQVAQSNCGPMGKKPKTKQQKTCYDFEMFVLWYYWGNRCLMYLSSLGFHESISGFPCKSQKLLVFFAFLFFWAPSSRGFCPQPITSI